MTLVSSGEISIGGSTSNRSINLELSRSATANSNLNESALRTLANKTSGTISLSDFYGKSNQSRWYPTGYSTTNSGILTNVSNMYDAEISSGTAFLASNQTTSGTFNCVNETGNYELIFNFGALSSKNIKAVLAITLYASAVSIGDLYLDCGSGPYQPPDILYASADVLIYYATTGSNWSFSHGYYAGNGGSNQSFTKSLVTLLSNISGSDVKIKFIISGYPSEYVYDDPGCASIYRGLLEGSAYLEIFGICAE